MGDHGTLYVADSVIPIYRSLLPLATIITPNQFEAEYVLPASPLAQPYVLQSLLRLKKLFPLLPSSPFFRTLANMKITSLPSLHALLTHLHTTYSLRHIIITSFSLPSPLPSSLISLPSPPASYQTRLAEDLDPSARDPSAHEQLLSVASSWTGRTDGVEQPEIEIEIETTLFQFPQIPGYFSGVGDLFSSLTLAHFSPPSSSPSSSSSSTSPSTPTPSPLATAASRALYSTQHILLSTHLRSQQLQAAAGDHSDDEADAQDRARRVARMRRRELGLIGKDARVDLEGGGVWEGTKVDLLDV
jgi:pyridoxine kinase